MFTMDVCFFQVYSQFDVHHGCVFLSGVFTVYCSPWMCVSFRCIHSLMFTMDVCSFQVYSHFNVHWVGVGVGVFQVYLHFNVYHGSVFLSGVFTL